MADSVRVSGTVGGEGREMAFEAGELAQLAHGSVVVWQGNTSVLVTAVTSEPREGIDFFPLTVDVEERMYAAGKIPGSFFRREGRPTEQAILTCRLTDRPLRPSFPDGFRNEVQVISTILGSDQVHPYDVASINGASAALVMSGIPFGGPIGAVRLGHIDGRWVAHPTYQERERSTFDMVVAGRRVDGDVALMMVEAAGSEHTWALYEEGAPHVTEDVIAEGLEVSKQAIGESVDLQLRLREEYERVRGPIEERAYTPRYDYDDDVMAAVRDIAEGKVSDALAIADKSERNARLDAITEEAQQELAGTADAPGRLAGRERQIRSAVRALQKDIVRTRIVTEGFRIDGRKPDELRPLSAKVGIIPTAHGTGLFQRGETQVLSVATLGMPRMEQMLDTIGLEDSKRYMHHYNFPPFSTSETGRVGSPRRREIGHGALAERALLPVVPLSEEFPYALRVVSDVLASNGSTSMASVCGSTLSLMDAGVPLKAAVAGIAMGLVYKDGEYTTLTDILGAEDAFGDMDFKVAGTDEFVTALQLDTKLDGLPSEVLGRALQQAREARLQILDVMRDAISEPRDEVAETAPKIVSMTVPIDKVGEVIGPKGKVINTIQQETGADINVDDDGVVGTVTVGAPLRSAVDEAIRRIDEIVNPPEAELGGIYQGKVVNITSFGAFVNVLPGRDGLVHISKIGGDKRIDKVEDVLTLGDELTVRVDEIDDRGKLSLSLVDEGDGGDGGAPAATEEREEAAEAPRERDRGGRGDGGRDRGDRDRGDRDRGDRDRGDRDRGDRDRGDRDRGDRDRGDRDRGDRDVVSFESRWQEEAGDEFGDLGPDVSTGRGGGRGGRGGGGGRSRRRR